MRDEIAKLWDVVGHLTRMMNTLTDEEKQTVLDRWTKEHETLPS